MSTYNTCIFCRKNDSKPSKEHLIPQWVAREFPDPQWESFNLNTGHSFKIHKSVGMVSKRPCERCNNGWMSHLESVAKPILLPLIHGSPSNLSPADQLVIIRWFIKTLILFDLNAEKTRPPYFTEKDASTIMTGLSVPIDTRIFLAAYAGLQGHVLAREWHIAPNRKSAQSMKTRHDISKIKGYVATFAIKHLALQVFSFRNPEHLSSEQLRIVVPDRWHNATIQIWPVTGNVQWPPGFILDDKAFDALATRWDGNMRILTRN